MSIQAASIPVGATYSPTGGTATSLVVLGQSMSEVSTFVGTSGVTQLTRSTADFSVKQPRANVASPGGFTQGRSKLKLSVPKVLASGDRTLNSATVEIAFNLETTSTEVAAIKTSLIAFLNDADFDEFWLNQATA